MSAGASCIRGRPWRPQNISSYHWVFMRQDVSYVTLIARGDHEPGKFRAVFVDDGSSLLVGEQAGEVVFQHEAGGGLPGEQAHIGEDVIVVEDGEVLAEGIIVVGFLSRAVAGNPITSGTEE